MHSINKITSNQINQLSPLELSRLLHTLLNIEAEKESLEDANILVPEKINVADEGEDGKIEWSGNPPKTKWLKNSLTIFQCKATDLSPKACSKEILKKGEKYQLKEQIEDMVNKGGCYTLFTNAELNGNQINRRIKGFREALSKSGNDNFETIQIYIYDANQIKDWVNENIASVSFVQSCLNITRPQGFRTWEQWKNDMPGSHIPYQSNEYIKFNSKHIRDLLNNNKVVRVIGHSGLGKTRLVLETFNSDKIPEIKGQQEQIVYYDLGFGSLENIYNYFISHKDRQSGIIVLDNCEEADHIAISKQVKNSGNFKIITIDLASETQEKSFIKLDRENQRDIVRKIIDAKFSNSFTQTDKEYISEQSEGYPQMAVLFSESVKSTGTENLHDQLPEDFYKKLIFGRNEEDEFEYEIIKACSVLKYFGFVDEGYFDILDSNRIQELKTHSDFIRIRICGRIRGSEVSESEFYRICKKYIQKNIIEQRGSYIMIKPTPLGIHLASKWWQETPPVKIMEILNELKSSELGRYLVERLRELDQLNKAKELVNKLWGVNSPFSSAEVLNTELGSLLFRYVVEVNPTATARALDNTFGSMSRVQLIKIDKGRRNLVWALEKLCFRKESFPISSRILFSFAVAENETWGNNATNQFIHLFQIYLPGTEVSLLERLNVIEWGLSKGNHEYERLAIKAMGKGLQSAHFTRMGGAEKQGSGPPLVDYRPDIEEIKNYREKILKKLINIAISNKPNASYAKEIIANSIRTLIFSGHYKLVLSTIEKIINKTSHPWLDALKHLKLVINFERERLDQETITKIEELISKLKPTDIKNQIILNVSKPEWHRLEKDQDGNYIDKPREIAEAFAQKLINENLPWEEHIDILQKGEQRQGINFGYKIGELTKNTDPIIKNAIQKLQQIEKENQNPEFIAGLLIGANDYNLSKKIIDEFIASDKIRHHTFYLTRMIKPKLSDIEKLFVLVDDYDFPVFNLQSLKYGSALEYLSNKEIELLINKLMEYDIPGNWTALSLLYRYCYNEEEKWLMNKNIFRRIFLSRNLTLYDENAGNIEGYVWVDSLKELLNNAEDDELAKNISKQIIEFCEQTPYNFAFESYIKDVTLFLFDNYFNTTWEVFGEGILATYPIYHNLEHIIGARNDAQYYYEGIAFRNSEKNKIIIEWCKKYPSKAPVRIAHMMPLFHKEEVMWHPFSKTIIDEFGNNKEVLKQISANIGTFGTMGSSVPYYKTIKKLLKSVTDHPIPEVKKWSNQMLNNIEETIKREKLDEEDFNMIY